MKNLPKIMALGLGCLLMFLLDLAPLPVVPNAEAQYGTRNRQRRRTTRRTAVVVGSAASAQTSQANAQAAQAQQQANTAKQNEAAAEQEAAAARAEAEAAKADAEAAEQRAAAAEAAAAVPPSPDTPLPIGTVVATLPAGCTSMPVDGVEYYHCGSNYYRAAFQGTQLVYVTAQP